MGRQPWVGREGQSHPQRHWPGEHWKAFAEDTCTLPAYTPFVNSDNLRCAHLSSFSSSALLTSSPLALFLLLISNPRPSGKNQVSALVSWAADILSPEVKVSYLSSKFLPFWSLNSTTILNCSRHWWNRMTLQLARKKLVEVHQAEHTVCLLCYCFAVVEIIHRQCHSHLIQCCLGSEESALELNWAPQSKSIPYNKEYTLPQKMPPSLKMLFGRVREWAWWLNLHSCYTETGVYTLQVLFPSPLSYHATKPGQS